MNYPMRADLKPGNKFPDFVLPDYKGQKQQLSKLVGKMPAALIFNRGYF